MATATTQWPSPSFPKPVQDLISLFYTLIESHTSDSGLRLANEVFAANGIMQSGTQRFSGREELIGSRAAAWTHIASRKHVIQKVYTGSVDELGGDVMMRGKLGLVLVNGTALEMEFVARMVVDDAVSAEPKVILCQIWADSAPLVKALSGAKLG